MGEVVRQSRDGAVLVLVIDSPPVNALGQAVRAGLADGLALAARDPEIHAVVIRAAGRTFPAGADISEFGKPAVPPLLPDLCNQIEALGKPVVAALHGTALGGGLELALAAHGRVADSGARLGLPEVGLGILPGAGGTQRLPRLIGAEQALRLMLTGRPVGAAEALALGMLDRVVEQDVAGAALAMARELAGTVPVPTSARRDGMRDPLAYQAAVATARRAQGGARLPGPGRIIDCVEAALLLPFDQGLAYERSAFLDLVATPEAAALRHVFFAERMAGRMPEAKAVARPVGSVAVIGGAGADTALALTQAGFAVVLVDPDRAALVAALERIAGAQEAAVLAGRLTPEARDADWARLTPALGLEAMAGADLVLAPAAALALVLTASRAGVMVVQTGGWADPAPDRAGDVAGLRLVGGLAEVVVGPGTAPETVAALLAIVRRLGRVAVRVAAPGELCARMLAAGRAAVAQIVAAGAAPGALAATLGRHGLPGLAGPAGPGAVPDEAVRRVLSALANEGARLLGAGLVQRASDIDLALVLGQGFARWQGGPMHWADARGLLVLRRDLRGWQAEDPAFWAVAPLIDDLLAKGQRFGDPG
ncbi:enoyl-CoA hydratase-related protein [Paracoccaceae bacterium Fryx2]|nr:enoyl-CoA hydratase-related protein [Paracoccaceae bacterium Fryx2]